MLLNVLVVDGDIEKVGVNYSRHNKKLIICDDIAPGVRGSALGSQLEGGW